MKRAEKIAQQNIVRADGGKGRKRQDHHLLPAAFLLPGVECAVGPQKAPANPREGPDQIGEQNRPDAFETAKPDEHGGHQEQKNKEQYTGCAEKCRVRLVFLQEQGNFFRVEHFFELAFERPVALLRRFLPDAVENSGQEICTNFQINKEEHAARRSDFFTCAPDLLFFLTVQANHSATRDATEFGRI